MPRWFLFCPTRKVSDTTRSGRHQADGAHSAQRWVRKHLRMTSRGRTSAPWTGWTAIRWQPSSPPWTHARSAWHSESRSTGEPPRTGRLLGHGCLVRGRLVCSRGCSRRTATTPGDKVVYGVVLKHARHSHSQESDCLERRPVGRGVSSPLAAASAPGGQMARPATARDGGVLLHREGEAMLVVAGGPPPCRR